MCFDIDIHIDGWDADLPFDIPLDTFLFCCAFNGAIDRDTFGPWGRGPVCCSALTQVILLMMMSGGSVRLCLKGGALEKMFTGPSKGGNARDIFCWPFEPHGRRLAAPSTAVSGGVPLPRCKIIIFALCGNPHGGGLRVPAEHMDVPCVTTVWNSSLLDSTRGGFPPPRCMHLNFSVCPGAWTWAVPGPYSVVHLIVVA